MSAVLHRIIALLEMSQMEKREGTRETERERGREGAHICVHTCLGTEQPGVDCNGSIFLFAQHSSPSSLTGPPPSPPSL